MGFGIKLKQLLKEKNMTIKELSAITGISKNTLYSITKRDTRLPSEETLLKIAEALNMDYSDLLSYEETKQMISNNLERIEMRTNDIQQMLSSHPELINDLTQSEINEIAFFIDFVKNRKKTE